VRHILRSIKSLFIHTSDSRAGILGTHTPQGIKDLGIKWHNLVKAQNRDMSSPLNIGSTRSESESLFSWVDALVMSAQTDMTIKLSVEANRHVQDNDIKLRLLEFVTELRLRDSHERAEAWIKRLSEAEDVDRGRTWPLPKLESLEFVYCYPDPQNLTAMLATRYEGQMTEFNSGFEGGGEAEGEEPAEEGDRSADSRTFNSKLWPYRDQRHPAPLRRLRMARAASFPPAVRNRLEDILGIPIQWDEERRTKLGLERDIFGSSDSSSDE
jgi:hypothetical protein